MLCRCFCVDYSVPTDLFIVVCIVILILPHAIEEVKDFEQNFNIYIIALQNNLSSVLYVHT